MVLSLRGTIIFLQLFPVIAHHLLSTCKLQTYIFVQDCHKRLEIVAVLFGRGHSVIVVTIGSEVGVSIEGRSRQVVRRERSGAV